MQGINIVIVDDQALLRDGLKTVLELEEGLTVSGMAKNGMEALELVERLRPDIMLMDIRMPEMDGVECVKLIKERHPDIRVIMLTTFNDDEYIMKAIANGADGYLLKDIEVDKLVDSIHDACAGKTIMPQAVFAKLAEGLGRIGSSGKGNEQPVKPMPDLSEREREICGMMVKGFNNKQIAMALYISEGTVRNYISAIYGKIGVGDRTRAVLHLKELGIN